MLLWFVCIVSRQKKILKTQLISRLMIIVENTAVFLLTASAVMTRILTALSVDCQVPLTHLPTRMTLFRCKYVSALYHFLVITAGLCIRSLCDCEWPWTVIQLKGDSGNIVWLMTSDHFVTAWHRGSAVYGVVVFVCLSVTSRCSTEMAKHRITQTTP